MRLCPYTGVIMKKVFFIGTLTACITVLLCAFTGCETTEDGKMMSLETQAKQAYLDSLRKEHNLKKATIKDVSFEPFLGVYDDALVAGFNIKQNVFDFYDVVDGIEIDGVYIEWWVGIPILVYKDGNLFKLKAAVEQGILSKESLTTIKDLFIEYNELKYGAIKT